MTTVSTDPETERPVLPADRVGANEVFLRAVLDRERAFCDVGEKRLLRVRPQLRAHQVVDFGQDRPRQHPLAWAILVQVADGCVMAISLVDQREDGAGVGDDHRDRPIPFSNSSARSLRSRRPLENAPRLFGARRGS